MRRGENCSAHVRGEEGRTINKFLRKKGGKGRGKWGYFAGYAELATLAWKFLT